jgi:hypothetical protein
VPNPIIAIDLSAVTYQVLDVSTKQLASSVLRHPRAVGFARRWEEIVVNSGINPEAILEFIPVGPKP